MSLADAWEEHADEWIAWARARGHDGFWEGTWPALKAALPDPVGLTVEVGCGEGRATRSLLSLGHQVLTVERSPRLAVAARTSEPPAVVAVADAAALPMMSASAALVVASMVLQDLDDLDSSLTEVARVLCPGGRLCFAIVHPFSSAQDPENFGIDGPLVVGRPYLSERRYVDRVEKDGLSMTFVSVHRPLSAYFTALHAAGLSVELLTEHGEGIVPWLLVCRARKNSADHSMAPL